MRSSSPADAGHLVDQLAVVPQTSGAAPGCARARRGDRLADVAHLGGDGPQELAAHRRVEEQVPDLDPRARRRRSTAGPATARRRGRRSRRRRAGPAAAIAASTWATPPMEASASPRKPSVPMRNRSSASCELAGGVAGEGERQVVGVRCRSRRRRRGSARRRPARRRCRCAWRRRRRLFSSSSLTTLAGRSMTSPAAILVTDRRQLLDARHGRPTGEGGARAGCRRALKSFPHVGCDGQQDDG